MTTIEIQVPVEFAERISSWSRDNWLQKLRQYKQDKDDIKLVENEMSKPQKGVSLKNYIKKWQK